MPLDPGFFTEPMMIATFSVALIWAIATACRQWFKLPALPVAAVVASGIALLGIYGSPEQVNVVGSVLQVIFLTLTAAGVNVGVNALRRFRAGDETTVASAEMFPRRRWYDAW